MSIEEVVLTKLRTLPTIEQRKVLEFVESLTQPNRNIDSARELTNEINADQEIEARKRRTTKRKNPAGMFAHLGIHISAEEIDESRREMWGEYVESIPKDKSK